MKHRLEFLILTLAAGAVLLAGMQFNFYPGAMPQGLAAISTTISFSGTLAGVIAGGYILMFIGMVIEGPIITAAGAFAAALGYFNIWIVIALAIAGDLVGDFIYYGIGYAGRVAFVEKYGHRVGLTKLRMKRLERLIKKHPKKTMLAVKLAPFLPTPCLMMMGASRVSLKEYAMMSIAIILPRTLIFAALGFYFGQTYGALGQYLENGAYLIALGVIVAVIAYYVYKKAAAVVSARLEAI